MAFCFDRKCHLIGNGAVFCSSDRYQRGHPAAFLECTVRRWALNPFRWGIQMGFVTPTTPFLTVCGQMATVHNDGQRGGTDTNTNNWAHMHNKLGSSL